MNGQIIISSGTAGSQADDTCQQGSPDRVINLLDEDRGAEIEWWATGKRSTQKRDGESIQSMWNTLINQGRFILDQTIILDRDK